MDNKYRIPSNLSKTLAALAVGTIALIAMDNPVTAAPTKDSLKLAEVGIRSRINAPIPLNLRPRSHRPSPRGDYRGYDRDDGYYEGHGDECDRRHHRHTHRHRDRRYPYNARYKRRSNRSRVIILNAPGKLRGYGDRNSYIRVIGK